MFEPRNEQGVIIQFAMQAEEAGWEIVDIGTAFPDAILSKNGQVWRTEFEFLASNFLMHGHNPAGCDLIVCWENDLEFAGLPILELSSDWINESLTLWTDEQKQNASWSKYKAYPSVLGGYVNKWGHLVDANLKVKVLDFFRCNPNANFRECSNALRVDQNVMLACIGMLCNDGKFRVQNLWWEVNEDFYK